MKADLSRNTFNPRKHYSSVRMQQGRVQLDADWNEQLDIQEHRVATGTEDVVGRTGAAIASAGFHLVAAVTDLSAEEQARPENTGAAALAGAGDFYISGGRYYVEGTLVQNERIVPYSAQPHWPAPVLPSDPGTYLAYLDLWQRHVTALEDDAIREKALGGPDTATRTQTTWQVRLLRAGDIGDPLHCLSTIPAWDDLIAPPTGRLAARAQPGAAASNPCIVPATAGFRRLENQLYRVEVHGPGNRGTATFTWSRENGSVVARWATQSGDQITVENAGRDAALGFAAGDWVELIDAGRELTGAPGTLVRLAGVNGVVLTLDPATATGPTTLGDFPIHPRVRCWDGDGLMTPTNSDFLDLEDGVQVSLAAGSYRTGDYWLIPARTRTADVEWPEESGAPANLRPEGIRHLYARLAIMRFDGTAWTQIDDCRDLFPPLTELMRLSYVSGDGQEAMPNEALAKPLVVGVSRGRHPVAGARVRFTLDTGDGALEAGGGAEEPGATGTLRVALTGADGLASCGYRLGSATGPRVHCVHAELIDSAGDPVHLPIRFNASLSLASAVWYDGSACPTLAPATTVQDAIDTVAAQAAIIRLRGDGQHAPVGQPLLRPLVAAVSNVCGPVENARVSFAPEGNGRVAAAAADLATATPGKPLPVSTDAAGHASVHWQLDPDPANRCQHLAAELVDAASRPLRAPSVIGFTGCHAPGLDGCLQFLDELRANGVVRPTINAPLGLEVSIDPAAPDRVAYTAGIVYVAGCRHEVAAGVLDLNFFTLPNTVIVDDQGVVQLLAKGREPPDWAELAQVDLNPATNQAVRVIDLRTDLTHLDARVARLEQEAARRATDRRDGIPDLTDTVPSLRQRDRRNYILELIPAAGGNVLPWGIAHDGASIWVANVSGTEIFRVDRDLTRFSQVESIDVGRVTIDACYDGRGQVWFSAYNNDLLIGIDVTTGARTELPVGDLPTKMAASQGLLWVVNASSRSMSVIDTGRGRVAETVAILDPTSGQTLQPTSIVADGEFVWVGTNTGRLFRRSWGLGAPLELVLADPNNAAIQMLGFDGANVWMNRGSTLFVVNARNPNLLERQIPANQAQWPSVNAAYQEIVCDGRRAWVPGRDVSDDAPILDVVCAFGCTFGTFEGRRPFAPQNIIRGLVYDGVHLWASLIVEEGPRLARFLP